jgi:hypothetical protein
MLHRPTFTSCLALFVAMAWMMSGSARASTVFWGSPFNSVLLTSNAQPLDGSFSFEMGTFGSFVPTFQNVDLWSSNWKIIDRAFDPTPADPNDGDPEGWNVVDQFFVGTVVHDSLGHSDSPYAGPTDVFAQGEKVYLWVFNDKANIPGTEWALVTNTGGTGDPAREWEVPDPNDIMGSHDWQLEDADTAIIGGLNDVQGDGFFFSSPGTFSLQTAVVPEPGSALLLAASAFCFYTRRRRRPLSRPCFNRLT